MLRDLMKREKYKSHLPALIACAKQHEIRRVIEFGCGRYSTLAFLNRKWFPDVEQCVSIEHDWGYINEVHDLIGNEDRHRFVVENLDKFPLMNIPSMVDLLFIDCEDESDYAVRRLLVQKFSKSTTHKIIVVHDINDAPLWHAVEQAGFKYSSIYHCRSGCATGVYSNVVDVSMMEFDSGVLDPGYKVDLCICTRDGNPSKECYEAAVMDAGMHHDVHVMRQGFSIAHCRNLACRKFLNGDSDAILFVDDTVIIPEGTIDALMNPEDDGIYDIVAGVVPTWTNLYNFTVPVANVMAVGMGNWFMTWPKPEVFEIERCGMACTLIRRNVLEAIKFPWFVWPPDHTEDPVVRSEDMEFCHNVRSKGFVIYCNGRVQCEHHRMIALGGLLHKFGTELPSKTWKRPRVVSKHFSNVNMQPAEA